MKRFATFDADGNKTAGYIDGIHKNIPVEAIEISATEETQYNNGYIRDFKTGKPIAKPPYIPSLKDVKTAKLAETDAWTAANITGGFTSSCSGQNVRYDSDKDTQITMQGIALNASTNEFSAKYPQGCPVRGYENGQAIKTIQYLNGTQVLNWCADLSLHIGTCKQNGWKKQEEINACKTVEDVEKIVFNNVI